MKKSCSGVMAALLLMVVTPARAQTPDTSWCTPQNACSVYFQGAATGFQGPWIIPATAQTIGIAIVADSITGSGTVTLQTAPCATFAANGVCSTAGTFTTCATGTLNTTPTVPLPLSCASSSTSAGWTWFQVSFGSGIAGSYHGRAYAQGPNLAGVAGFPFTLGSTSIAANSSNPLLSGLSSMSFSNSTCLGTAFGNHIFNFGSTATGSCADSGGSAALFDATVGGTIIATGSNSVSGCSNSSASGGSFAGQFTSGTTGTCTATVTLGTTAPHAWTCWASDTTTPADRLTQSGVLSASTATLTGTTASGDIITWGCVAY